MSWRDEHGTSSTELVLVTPVLLLLILLGVQFGVYLHAAAVVEATAAEALEATQTEQGSAAAGQATADVFLTQVGGVIAPSVAVMRGAGRVTVRVAGTAPQVVPGLDLAVDSTATGPVERFIPEPAR